MNSTQANTTQEFRPLPGPEPAPSPRFGPGWILLLLCLVMLLLFRKREKVDISAKEMWLDRWRILKVKNSLKLLDLAHHEMERDQNSHRSTLPPFVREQWNSYQPWLNAVRFGNRVPSEAEMKEFLHWFEENATPHLQF